MENLNIYTFRELIKMYIDERPMPDVAFVTQTEAMKLQSMGKEMNNNSKWITDRRPTEEDADYGDVHLDGYVYVTNERGMTRTATWKAVAYDGFPWQPIMIPEPYVKQKRFRVEYDEKIGYYVLITADLIVSLPYLSDKHAHKEVAERIAPIYEEMFP